MSGVTLDTPRRLKKKLRKPGGEIFVCMRVCVSACPCVCVSVCLCLCLCVFVLVGWFRFDATGRCRNATTGCWPGCGLSVLRSHGDHN